MSEDCLIYLDSDSEPASPCKYLCSDDDGSAVTGDSNLVFMTSREIKPAESSNLHYGTISKVNSTTENNPPPLILIPPKAEDASCSVRYLEDSDNTRQNVQPCVDEITKVRFLNSDEEELPTRSGNTTPVTVATVITADNHSTSSASADVRSRSQMTIRRSVSRRAVRYDDSEEDYNPEFRLGRRSRRQSRRRITAGAESDLEVDQAMDSVLAAPTAATFRPETTGIRPRSTRREARRATLRISLSTNFFAQASSSEENFDEEKIVQLDEISMASDDGEKFLTDDENDGNKSFSCIICAETKAMRPMKTTCCGQPLGCKTCAKRWYHTTNISELNSRSPLSRGQTHDNHKRCPFCRKSWPTTMLICPM